MPAASRSHASVSPALATCRLKASLTSLVAATAYGGLPLASKTEASSPACKSAAICRLDTQIFCQPDIRSTKSDLRCSARQSRDGFVLRIKLNGCLHTLSASPDREATCNAESGTSGVAGSEGDAESSPLCSCCAFGCDVCFRFTVSAWQQQPVSTKTIGLCHPEVSCLSAVRSGCRHRAGHLVRVSTASHLKQVELGLLELRLQSQ